MRNHPFTLSKILIIIFIIICLILSVMFSAGSVTGYIVAEEIDSAKNIFSLVFLLLGVFSAIIYLTKFR